MKKMNQDSPQATEGDDDPFKPVAVFYMMEHDSIHKILEDNKIEYEIEIYDDTPILDSHGGGGNAVRFALFIHEDHLEKARALLENHLPK